jgi:hypothetical protein
VPLTSLTQEHVPSLTDYEKAQRFVTISVEAVVAGIDRGSPDNLA